MTHPPRITDESVLVRWMGLEIAKMNEGVVSHRKSLAVLLTEKDPVSVTKKGETYHFDRIGDRDFGKRPAGRPAAAAKAPGLVLCFPGHTGQLHVS